MAMPAIILDADTSLLTISNMLIALLLLLIVHPTVIVDSLPPDLTRDIDIVRNAGILLAVISLFTSIARVKQIAELQRWSDGANRYYRRRLKYCRQRLGSAQLTNAQLIRVRDIEIADISSREAILETRVTSVLAREVNLAAKEQSFEDRQEISKARMIYYDIKLDQAASRQQEEVKRMTNEIDQWKRAATETRRTADGRLAYQSRLEAERKEHLGQMAAMTKELEEQQAWAKQAASDLKSLTQQTAELRRRDRVSHEVITALRHENGIGVKPLQDKMTMAQMRQRQAEIESKRVRQALDEQVKLYHRHVDILQQSRSGKYAARLKEELAAEQMAAHNAEVSLREEKERHTEAADNVTGLTSKLDEKSRELLEARSKIDRLQAQVDEYGQWKDVTENVDDTDSEL